ncbi:hypothetical protein N9W00_00915 [Arcobacteraceae bacterium]|nr:hypothetical protein [Arcobacteraceae bacterium]
MKFIRIFCEKEQEEYNINVVHIVMIKESKIYENTGTIFLSNSKELQVSGKDWKKIKDALDKIV